MVFMQYLIFVIRYIRLRKCLLPSLLGTQWVRGSKICDIIQRRLYTRYERCNAPDTGVVSYDERSGPNWEEGRSRRVRLWPITRITITSRPLLNKCPWECWLCRLSQVAVIKNITQQVCARLRNSNGIDLNYRTELSLKLHCGKVQQQKP
jgi:hypothetical protein